MKVIDGGGEGSVISIERFKRDKPTAARGCQHRAVKIDTDDRVLQCRDCGADVDPFAYILFLSRHWSDVKHAIAMQDQQRRDIRTKMEAADKDLARLRSRVSRLRSTSGEVSEARAYKAGIERGAELLEERRKRIQDATVARDLDLAAMWMRQLARDAEHNWKPT